MNGTNEGFTILGVPYWGPYNKAFLIFGTLFSGSPIFANLHENSNLCPKDKHGVEYNLRVETLKPEP